MVLSILFFPASAEALQPHRHAMAHNIRSNFFISTYFIYSTAKLVKTNGKSKRKRRNVSHWKSTTRTRNTYITAKLSKKMQACNQHTPRLTHTSTCSFLPIEQIITAWHYPYRQLYVTCFLYSYNILHNRIYQYRFRYNKLHVPNPYRH